jgi:hypothetical protein
MFYEQNYNAFPTWLSFITKLNSNQLNIKKKKLTKIILKKNITKKENTKETRKKPCEEKLYQSIVFCEKKLVFTCNCNS